MLKTSLGLALLWTLVASTANAGTLWNDPFERNGAELRWALPQLEVDDVTPHVLSLTGRRRLNEDLTLHGDLVFSTVGADGERGSVVGNPYLGVELGKKDMLWTVEGGLRLPLVPDSPSTEEIAALFTGLLTDFNVRPGAYAGDAVPIELNFRYRSGDARTSRGIAHMGVELWAPTGDREESERFFTYGGQVWINARPLLFDLGIEGRVAFDESGDDNEMELSAGLQVQTAHVRPGIQLRVPTGDLQNFVDFTVAAYVGVY